MTEPVRTCCKHKHKEKKIQTNYPSIGKQAGAGTTVCGGRCMGANMIR